MFCDVAECLQKKPTGDGKMYLFKQQKASLDLFLSNGALDQEEYNRSYNALVQKMGMQEYANELSRKE